MIFKRFPFIAQHDTMDCGPACISMLSRYYGKTYGLQFLRENTYLSKDGVSLLGLATASERIGFDSVALKMTVDELIEKEVYPAVLFWEGCHFVVLYKIKINRFTKTISYYIADPAEGRIKLSHKQFVKCWTNKEGKGVVFAVTPNEQFHHIPSIESHSSIFAYFAKHLHPYSNVIFKLFVTFACGSLLTLAFPFFAQALIDYGVIAGDYNMVLLIILAQISLYFGTVVVEIVRNWLVLYMGACVNVSVVSDFFMKIMRLPISFFDSKFLGDFYQRIQDHSRIEVFLTSQSMTTFFSMINFLFFFYVLLNYNPLILIIYLLMTSVSVVWTLYYMKKRAYIDYFKFRTSAMNQEVVSEMIYGIEDIKLNNLENAKIDKWSNIQKELFKINLKSMKVEQTQSIGFECINQIKNLLVSLITANSVICGDMSLGGLVSVSYILGQLNSPINQLVVFLKSFQDASLSIGRLSEVQQISDEDSNLKPTIPMTGNRSDIVIKGLSYQYEGPHSPFVLNDINMTIHKGKTTAIVGSSGSGKTTLMKILLKFYPPTKGNVFIEGVDIMSISAVDWRKKIGVVMQEGYIFSDTVEQNVVCDTDNIDITRLQNAIKIANISDYIDNLPQGLQTMIGAAGNGMSCGQKQRLLIARSIYKSPDYIFFDEATSALDTNNEHIIQTNLSQFFSGRTVLIIAHRLSTVKNADQIIVLDKGKIVETGTHNSLIRNHGTYYNLVRNQLEMDTEL